MSGGSYDYAYFKVQDFINEMETREMTPERKRFAVLLTLVRDAMRAVEWVDSGDYADGDENSVIEKAFEFARGAKGGSHV